MDAVSIVTYPFVLKATKSNYPLGREINYKHFFGSKIKYKTNHMKSGMYTYRFSCKL